MHNLRRDIVELFSEAQNVLRDQLRSRNVLVLQGRDKGLKRRGPAEPAPYSARPITPLETMGAKCLCCAAVSARVVRGFALCESHALMREGSFKGWQRSKLQGAA